MGISLIAALLGFLLAGCGGTPPPGTSEPVPATPPSDPPCTGVVVESREVEMTCESETSFWYGSCSGQMVLLVKNCLEAGIEMRTLELTEKEGERKIVWTFEPGTVVGPGKEWAFERVLPVGEGEYDLMLTCGLDEKSTIVEWIDLVVTNPAMVKARDACEACNGDFDSHGMLGIVSCLCRTADAGRPCDDGNDCEGKCISGESGFTCSEFFTVFGCHSYLPPGWSQQTHTTPVKIPHICVD